MSDTERWTYVDKTAIDTSDRRPERDPPEPEMGTLEGPIYYVEMGGGLPDLMFSHDEYWRAYEHATGEKLEDGSDGHRFESRIHLWDITGTVEVPIYDV